ncbi:TRAP transporter substrate-binding protein DctP [candidate division KSB1 bacterium]
MRTKIFLLFLFLIIQIQTVVKGKAFEIKFATIAVEGSTWMNVMNRLNDDIQKSTNNQLKFKIYSGGVFGDELDVLRKMRFGQVHSAGFTGVGLGEILPEIRILELPFLFKNYDGVDYITEKFYDRFAKAFEKRDFVFLGWVEVGFVHIFTKTPIRTFKDIKKLNRMWVWEGDPLAEAVFSSFGLKPIQIPVLNVLTSLQTGLIDGVYTSPLGAISLQWFTRVKYMMSEPMTDATGAILISKKLFDKIPEDLQKILKDKCKSYMRELVVRSREDNEKSIEVLKDNGIEIVNTTEETIKKLEEIGVTVREKLTGKLYSKEFLDEILASLKEFRER